MRRRIILSILCIAALLLALALGWIYSISCSYLTIESGPAHADAIVVPGGSEDRAFRAAQLWKSGEAPTVIITGTGDWPHQVRVLQLLGVPNRAIVVERNACSTRENARLAVPILSRMGAKRVIIATSWYHSRRALACFRHYAPEIEFYSRPSYSGFPGSNRNGREPLGRDRAEAVKIIGYFFRYGIVAF